MEEGHGSNSNRDEIFSQAVRAGKRTYFFDVKTTRGNDLYLTITESKKRYNRDGKFYYEKHKLFLYKEDFEKFSDGLKDSIDKIQELKASGQYPDNEHTHSHSHSDATTASSDEQPTAAEEPKVEYGSNEDTPKESNTSFTDVSFDDLGA